MKNTRRVFKTTRYKIRTQLDINKGIQGDSIENMLERLRIGEGEEAITDRDLVYNDNESNTINPLTNIRSDKMELMLEEKIGEYEHKHRKANKKANEEVEKIVEEENKNLNENKEAGGEE